MAMRETVRSLRAYLILSGSLSGLSYLNQLVSANPAMAMLFSLAGLAVSLSYIFVVSVAVGAAVPGAFASGLGLLITWYIYANVRRMIAEAQTAPVVAAG
jgi:hypothetical protein